MTESCSHTELMNILICLGRKNNVIEPLLANNGYPLESIGGRIITKNGVEVHPDLSFISHAEKGFLLVDCKSGTLEEKQSNAYKEVDVTTLKELYKVSIDGTSTVNITWCCSEINLEKIKQKNNEWGTNFPILYLSKNNSLLKLQTFTLPTLEKVFSKEIILPKNFPISYYPFSKDDPDEDILIPLFASIVRLCANPMNTDKKFTLDELLRDSHPSYDYIDSDEKKELKGRISKLINFLADDELKEDIRRYPGEKNCWQFIKKLIGFRSKCQQLINNYNQIKIRKEQKDKQKNLDDEFTPS